MWPKLLDLSRDECRGLLRRLELDSYSTVIGAFRAQGTLNETKIKILKDLREAFHISDDRHKAEIRRVVNDEYLSTVAKMIYGPNSEIEWNTEGSRRYLIIDRKLSKTALSIVADSASCVGKKLNENLLSPARTARAPETSHNSHDSQNSNGSAKLVVEDPNNYQVIQNMTKSNSSTTNCIATNSVDESKRKTSTRINNFDDIYYTKDHVQSGYIENKSNSIKYDIENAISKPTMMNRRRKTITAVNYDSPTMMKINVPLEKSKVKLSSANDDHPAHSNHFSEKTINAAVDANAKVNTLKLNARDAFNVAKVSRIFEIIEGNTVKTALSVVKPSAPILKRPKIAPTQTIVNSSPITKSEPIKSCASNILKQKLPIKSFADSDVTKKDDLLNLMRKQMIQTVDLPRHKKDFIPIPSARNPNIVKTNERTIMHVTPIQQNDQLTIQNLVPKKHIVQVISPQTHPRTITIHPNNVNWQNYDPSNIVISNEYANETIAGNIEDDIIAEEYIASEDFSPDNVIEMVYDGAEV